MARKVIEHARRADGTKEVVYPKTIADQVVVSSAAGSTDTLTNVLAQIDDNIETLQNEKLDKSAVQQSVGSSETDVMSQKAVTTALADVGTGFFKPKNFTITGSAGAYAVAMIDYDADEWSPNYILHYGATLPTPPDTSLYLAIREASDPLTAATDKIAAYVWNGSAWESAVPASLDIADGDLFVTYPDDDGHFWLGSQFKPMGVSIDLSAYRTAAAQDTIDAAKAPIASPTFTGTVTAPTYIEGDRRVLAAAWNGVCVSPAAQISKDVTTEPYLDYVRSTGTRVNVRFTNANTAANPTLVVNGGSPMPMYRNGVRVSGSGVLLAGETYTFEFDGTQWNMLAPVSGSDFIAVSQKGAANGVAPLDANKMVPAANIGITPGSYISNDVRNGATLYDGSFSGTQSPSFETTITTGIFKGMLLEFGINTSSTDGASAYISVSRTFRLFSAIPLRADALILDYSLSSQKNKLLTTSFGVEEGGYTAEISTSNMTAAWALSDVLRLTAYFLAQVLDEDETAYTLGTASIEMQADFTGSNAGQIQVNYFEYFTRS
jgi:hypothetical protein